MGKIKHGYYSKKATPAQRKLYKTWEGMKRRCNNPNTPEYRLYGGRGITVCDEWNKDFVYFKDWAECNGYREELTLDRAVMIPVGELPDGMKRIKKTIHGGGGRLHY